MIPIPTNGPHPLPVSDPRHPLPIPDPANADGSFPHPLRRIRLLAAPQVLQNAALYGPPFIPLLSRADNGLTESGAPPLAQKRLKPLPPISAKAERNRGSRLETGRNVPAIFPAGKRSRPNFFLPFIFSGKGDDR